VVDVWWGAGESRRNSQLADGQARALAKYLERIASVGDDSDSLWGVMLHPISISGEVDNGQGYRWMWRMYCRLLA
jgi:hypothetical protein